MSKDIRKLIHRVYGITMSAVIVIVGIRFILGCYWIYTNGKAAGGQIYSRAAVAEAFAPMAVSVYLCLALVIGSFILHYALPYQKKKQALEKNRQLILQRLKDKTDLKLCDPELQHRIARLQNFRLLHIMISAILLVIASAAFLAHVCRSDIWPAISEVTATMVESAFALLISMAIPAGYSIFTAYFCRSSLDKEIELMRTAAKQAPRESIPVASAKNQQVLLAVRYLILGLAVGLVIAGYSMGGAADVIGKAAKICTECVGLG